MTGKHIRWFGRGAARPSKSFNNSAQLYTRSARRSPLRCRPASFFGLKVAEHAASVAPSQPAAPTAAWPFPSSSPRARRPGAPLGRWHPDMTTHRPTRGAPSKPAAVSYSTAKIRLLPQSRVHGDRARTCASPLLHLCVRRPQGAPGRLWGSCGHLSQSFRNFEHLMALFEAVSETSAGQNPGRGAAAPCALAGAGGPGRKAIIG